MRERKAVDYFRKGYNCAQSVLLAFENDVQLDAHSLSAMGSSLGAGFARSRNLCGAVNAMGILYGLSTGNDDKASAYQAVDKMVKEFEAIYSNVNCGSILKGVTVTPGLIPQERTKEYYAKRPCEKVVEDCVLILENNLFDNKLNQ